MPARVLIADHRSHIVRILDHRCRQAGLETSTAEDAEEATDALADGDIDLVITQDRFDANWAEVDALPPFIMLTGAMTTPALDSATTGPILATFATPFRPGIVVRTARALIEADRIDDEGDARQFENTTSTIRDAA